MCTVTINLRDIVSIEEEPMGRSGETGNDLYLIYISQDRSQYVYAHGLFDNLSNITVQLVEGEIYDIEAVAVKNGKNMIAGGGDDGFYAYPFFANLTNSMVYDKEYDFLPILYYLKGANNGLPAFIVPGLEVYYGGNSGYKAEENGESISINFSRFAACAAEFKAFDMPEGYLKINIEAEYGSNHETYTTDNIIVESVSKPNFQYITFGADLFGTFTSEGVTCTLNLTWVKNNETEIVLMPASITFKPNIKYNITVKVDNTTSPSINVTPIVDYSFTDTEDIGILGTPIPNQNN